MSATKQQRVMWLLNHTTLRQFESGQLVDLGVSELFVPKSFPYDDGNLSANVTYEFDGTLKIPLSEIDVLNAQDWYGEPTHEAWEIANRHFDVAFIGFFPRQMLSVCKHFKGAIVLRAFGFGGRETYSKLLRQVGGEALESAIFRCGKRFWFGIGYDHLAEIEDPFLADRAVFMPVGLKNTERSDQWEGKDRLVFFVCPRIGSSPYFSRCYREFRGMVEGFPYRIGGAQPIAVDDPNVLGFVSGERYAEIMRQSRVMFYHSQEPNHIHYHPFEAIRAGMPLLFMAGGMLDRMGGVGLPGRCATKAEARRKIERVLADDWGFIERIRTSQAVLLEPMKPENCKSAWRAGFARITSELESWRAEQAARPKRVKRKRIAVILPMGYRGGTLRGALALAQALYLGSRQAGEDADIVFLHLDDAATYAEQDFADCPDAIVRRPFDWKILTSSEARRAMRYAGYRDWEPTAERYVAPDDGMQQAMDCDLWLIVSDRLLLPMLPIRPVVLMVYDYLQRYQDLLSGGADQPFLSTARSAERVLVTTEFTRRDALQYAGIEPRKVRKLPMLAPDFPIQHSVLENSDGRRPYFIWPTNAARHKNHMHAVEALQIYYEDLEGQWDCRVTGTDTQGMLASELPHLKAVAEIFELSNALRQRVTWLGELPDAQYRRLLAHAGFLWHAARIDNGTFAVIEAACFGIPALSSDYPAMREIDAQFSLNLAWMDPDSPRHMAEQLKRMEREAASRRCNLPSASQLGAERIESHAKAYWREIRACL